MIDFVDDILICPPFLMVACSFALELALRASRRSLELLRWYLVGVSILLCVFMARDLVTAMTNIQWQLANPQESPESFWLRIIDFVRDLICIAASLFTLWILRKPFDGNIYLISTTVAPRISLHYWFAVLVLLTTSIFQDPGPMFMDAWSYLFPLGNARNWRFVSVLAANLLMIALCAQASWKDWRHMTGQEPRDEFDARDLVFRLFCYGFLLNPIILAMANLPWMFDPGIPHSVRSALPIEVWFGMWLGIRSLYILRHGPMPRPPEVESDATYAIPGQNPSSLASVGQ